MKIVSVVQRYGEQVIGGAESLAREICTRLSGEHELTVITSCALDYRTWDNALPPGECLEDGVRVIRCPSIRSRDWESFGRFSSLVFAWNRLLPIPEALQKKWIQAQGPLCPSLLEALEAESRDADLVIFFTILYYPAVFGLPLVGKKALLVPTAHDEPALKLSLFQRLFKLPGILVFLSPEEKDFVNRAFDVSFLRQEMAGYGVDCPEIGDLPQGEYFLYLGRIEKGKGCGEMFEFARRAGLDMKAAGPMNMPVPEDIDYRGIVSEEEKKELLEQARAIVIPSRNESLSISALEAWAAGKPVIVSSGSPVLAGQARRSKGGISYASFQEFREAAELVSPEMGLLGREFVKRNYSWDAVMARWREIIRMATGD